jgi:hypothetical protein
MNSHLNLHDNTQDVIFLSNNYMRSIIVLQNI